MRISDWSSDVCSSDLDVAVGVVTNSLAANDVPAVHAGYASYRGQLLDGGVELYELRAQGAGETHGLFGSSGASLHTKAFVIDGERGFIGSFNLDPRSAYLNTEMGVLFEDDDIARALREEYLFLAGPALSYEVCRDEARSEEHTSELQSLMRISYAVFCLKKKN